MAIIHSVVCRAVRALSIVRVLSVVAKAELLTHSLCEGWIWILDIESYLAYTK